MRFIRKLGNAGEHNGTCRLCDKMKAEHAEYYLGVAGTLITGMICEECFNKEIEND
tara:strand:+ start:408 stop:575 length:168 start_codon:yes stop_codon:yes gene_type:complete